MIFLWELIQGVSNHIRLPTKLFVNFILISLLIRSNPCGNFKLKAILPRKYTEKHGKIPCFLCHSVANIPIQNSQLPNSPCLNTSIGLERLPYFA